MDLYFVLRQVSEVSIVSSGFKSIEDTKAEILKFLKLLRFAGASMWIMKKVLGLEDKYLLCEPDERRGKALLEKFCKQVTSDIMTKG